MLDDGPAMIAPAIRSVLLQRTRSRGDGGDFRGILLQIAPKYDESVLFIENFCQLGTVGARASSYLDDGARKQPNRVFMVACRIHSNHVICQSLPFTCG